MNITRHVLPPPFASIEIPAGKIIIEKHGDLEVPAFTIAKYPITVAQYTVFVEARGYNRKDYWTLAGWQWRRKENVPLSRYWNDKDHAEFFKPNHPIIGVSWFESYAFTQWLADMTGEHIHLPTEQQWQRAAQGDDDREYPWGNHWDATRCNNSIEMDWEEALQTGSTSPVT